jgi:hypothetical protein
MKWGKEDGFPSSSFIMLSFRAALTLVPSSRLPYGRTQTLELKSHAVLTCLIPLQPADLTLTINFSEVQLPLFLGIVLGIPFLNHGGATPDMRAYSFLP